MCNLTVVLLCVCVRCVLFVAVPLYCCCVVYLIVFFCVCSPCAFPGFVNVFLLHTCAYFFVFVNCFISYMFCLFVFCVCAFVVIVVFAFVRGLVMNVILEIAHCCAK